MTARGIIGQAMRRVAGVAVAVLVAVAAGWAPQASALMISDVRVEPIGSMGVNAAQVLAMKLEQKRWVFEQYYTKMQVADSDKQFTAALGAMTKVMDIDPEKVADVFDAANEALDAQVDTDKFWEKMYNKEMAGATGALEDHVPSMDDLGAQLEQEVAAEVGGAAAPAAADREIDSRIAAGQARVRNMLEGK